MKHNGTMHTETAVEEEDEKSAIDQVETLFEKAGDYAETRFRIFQLKAVDKISDMASAAISGLVVAVAFIFFFGMLNIGIALFIGSLLGDAYAGFLIMAGLYLLLWLLFRSMNEKWFKIPIANRIIKMFFDR